MNATLLVVNGDDGGLHRDTDDALLRCAAGGLMRSVSVVAGGATAREMVARASDAGIGIGLHLNLTEGAPLAGSCATLTGRDGRFRSKLDAWCESGSFDPDEVAAEARAQLEHLRTLGADVDHVDGHNHIQLFETVVRGMIAAFGEEDLVFRVPDEPEAVADRPPFPACTLTAARLRELVAGTRWRTAERFVGFAWARRPRLESIAHLEQRRGTTEWMVHPGARPGSEFTTAPGRTNEAEGLCTGTLARRLAAWGYRAGVFGELQ